MNFCESLFTYKRRLSREVKIGKVGVGGTNPIRVQSMITCDTMDTDACIRQTLDLANAGCEIVRITAPTVNDARNLQHIKKGLLDLGCDVPIVADIHFKPEAAMEAAQWVEKIRINPGNYADTKKFAVKEYTDDQYVAELERIRERFTPLVALCKERGIAMRIGVNHGSLSDRIMNRYGDSPAGMVESALEFASIARELDYHDLVFSMKSSNPKVMINAYRLLAARLEELQKPETGDRNPKTEVQSASSAIPWNYPLHLGVTEAGDGEDARIKSAIGIGSLLADGIGDTIRVSLTEDSVHEIPVARALIDLVQSLDRGAQAGGKSASLSPLAFSLQPSAFSFSRRLTQVAAVPGILEHGGMTVRVGGEELVRVVIRETDWKALADSAADLGDCQPEILYEGAGIAEVDPRDDRAVAVLNASAEPQLVTISDGIDLPVIAAYRLLAAKLETRHPILIKDEFRRRAASDLSDRSDASDSLLASSLNIGSLLCDGIGDAILVQGEAMPEKAMRLSYNILQAAGSRIFKTEYVACPSCGRTLFNLQTATARIKAATVHLKGVKIAIMGCIVNGPGEMADADFGYVGGAPGKINLYVGKTAVKFNIPEEEAVERLKDLIREHGKWVEPPVAT